MTDDKRDVEIRDAIDSFNFDQARSLLREALKDPSSETYYLASLVSINERQRAHFLRKAVELDPSNQQASKELKQLYPHHLSVKSSDLHPTEIEEPEKVIKVRTTEPLGAKKTSEKSRTSSVATSKKPTGRFPLWWYALIAAAASILLVVVIAIVFSWREEPAGETMVSNQNEDVEVSLPDGAHVIARAGGILPGSTVVMQKLPSSEWENFVPEGLFIESVYTINAEEWTSNLSATITLPIDPKGLTTDQIESYQLAYYNSGKWIGVPSTVNISEETVSGTVDHFTWYAPILRLFNSAPIVVIETILSRFEKTRIDDLTTTIKNVEDLEVIVYVQDPKGEPLKVCAAYDLRSAAGSLVTATSELRREIAQKVVLEMAFDDALGAAAGVNAMKILAPSSRYEPELPCYEMDEVEPGVYWQGLELNGIEMGNTDSPLYEVRVQVDIEDGLGKLAPIRRHHSVYFDFRGPSDIGEPELVAPATLAVCSPEPVFEWRLPDWFMAESYFFRLVKGDDIEGGRKIEEWICYKDGCQRDGPGNPSNETWTVEKPLKEGIYTWTMASSDEDYANVFKDPRLVKYAQPKTFVVDKSLEGQDCSEGFNSESIQDRDAEPSNNITADNVIDYSDPNPVENTTDDSNTSNQENLASEEQENEEIIDALGSIAGELFVPSTGGASVLVAAFNLDSGDIYKLQESGSNYIDFKIENLPAGTYHVVGYLLGDSVGFTEFVTCGMKVECIDHSLIDVKVLPGQVANGVLLEDWDFEGEYNFPIVDDIETHPDGQDESGSIEVEGFKISGTLIWQKQKNIGPGAKVMVAWMTFDDRFIQLGEGTIDWQNNTFELVLPDQPPSEILVEGDGWAIGLGFLFLVNDLNAYKGFFNSGDLVSDALGAAGQHAVFYKRGSFTDPEGEASWMEDFEQGYSVGKAYKTTSVFDSLEPVDPSSIEIIIDDLENIDFMNIT